MPAKLNPCAKCGGQPSRWMFKGALTSRCYVVECMGCKREINGATSKAADDAWNAANPKEDEANE